MRNFSESTPNSKETIIILKYDEAEILAEALQEYCQNNKRKKKAKKLLDEFDKKLEIY